MSLQVEACQKAQTRDKFFGQTQYGDTKYSQVF